MTSAERQKLLLQQEIAKLSGRISASTASSSTYQPRSHTAYHPYRPPRGSTYRGGSSSRGRGSSRGGSTYSSTRLDLREINRAKATSANASAGPSTNIPAATSEAGPPTSNTGLSAKEKEDGEVSPTPSPDLPGSTKVPAVPAPPAKAAGKASSWIKSNGANMSLMTKEKRQQLNSTYVPPVYRPRKRAAPAQIQMLNSTSTPNGSQQVVVDGVIFQFEPGGKKLTRIGEVAASAANSTPTRRKLDFQGGSFRRTNLGNLVSTPSRPVREYCPTFTKTGKCTRANVCPYKHDPERLAICPLFLRNRGPHDGVPCTLSHTPSSHNTPSCVRFQATSTCHYPTCLYPHIRVSPTAPVCEAFARERWCPAPAGTCPNLHVWECQEWREHGRCSRGKACGLQHVLRADSGAGKAAAKKDGLEGEQVMSAVEVDLRGDLPEESGKGVGFDDGANWIGLGGSAGEWDMEQGAPGEVSEDGEGSSEVAEDEDEDDDDDDDEDEGDEAALITGTGGEEAVSEASSDDQERNRMDKLDDLGEMETGTDTEDDVEAVLGVVV